MPQEALWCSLDLGLVWDLIDPRISLGIRGFRGEFQAPPLSSGTFDLTTTWCRVDWSADSTSVRVRFSVQMTVICLIRLQLMSLATRHQ